MEIAFSNRSEGTDLYRASLRLLKQPGSKFRFSQGLTGATYYLVLPITTLYDALLCTTHDYFVLHSNTFYYAVLGCTTQYTFAVPSEAQRFKEGRFQVNAPSG